MPAGYIGCFFWTPGSGKRSQRRTLKFFHTNKMVEIIVQPVDGRIEKAVREKTIDDFAGIFEKHKNPDLISLEKEAWGNAVVEKHGNS